MNPYLNPQPAHSQESIKGGNRVTPYALLDTDSPHPQLSSSTNQNQNQNQNVYVVHADAGGEDLHIQLPNQGARVIEMPPQYQGGSSPPGSSQGASGSGMGKRARPGMGLRLSSGAQGAEGEEVAGGGGLSPGVGGGGPVSPMSQVPSEKSRH